MYQRHLPLTGCVKGESLPLNEPPGQQGVGFRAKGRLLGMTGHGWPVGFELDGVATASRCLPLKESGKNLDTDVCVQHWLRWYWCLLL